MSALEEIKKMVIKDFEELCKNPTSKEAVDKAAKLKNLVEDAEKEQQSIENKNKELLQSYSDAIVHQSFKEPTKDTIGGNKVNMDDIISKRIKELKKGD